MDLERDVAGNEMRCASNATPLKLMDYLHLVSTGHYGFGPTEGVPLTTPASGAPDRQSELLHTEITWDHSFR